MKTSALITELLSKHDTNATEADLLEWINTLERTLYRNKLVESQTAFIDVKAGQQTYSILTTDGQYEDIEILKVNGVVYTKRDGFLDEANYTYAKTDDGISLYPVPLTDLADGIELRCKKIPRDKTATNSSMVNLSIEEDFGKEWRDLYRFYLQNKMCIADREFEDADMYANMYDDKESDFWAWYADRIPTSVASHRKRRWR